MKDKDKMVALCAIEAVRNFGDPEALETLEKITTDKDADKLVKQKAEEAIGALIHRRFTLKGLETWENHLKNITIALVVIAAGLIVTGSSPVYTRGIAALAAAYSLAGYSRYKMLLDSVKGKRSGKGVSEDVARETGFRSDSFYSLPEAHRELINFNLAFSGEIMGNISMLPGTHAFLKTILKGKYSDAQKIAEQFRKAHSSSAGDLIEAAGSGNPIIRDEALQTISVLRNVITLEWLLHDAVERQDAELENIVLGCLINIGGRVALEAATSGVAEALYKRLEPGVQTEKREELIKAIKDICSRITDVRDVEIIKKMVTYYGTRTGAEQKIFLLASDIKAFNNAYRDFSRIIGIKAQSATFPRVFRANNKKTGEHSLKPQDVIRWARRTAVVSAISFVAGIWFALHPLSIGSFWDTAVLAGMGLYFTWAAIRYFSIFKDIIRSLAYYHREGHMLGEPNYENNILRDVSSAVRRDIAHTDGYRDISFTAILETAPRTAGYITLHEAFESHSWGMVSILPGVAWFFRNVSTKKYEQAKKLEDEYLRVLDEIGSLNVDSMVEGIDSEVRELSDAVGEMVSDMTSGDEVVLHEVFLKMLQKPRLRKKNIDLILTVVVSYSRMNLRAASEAALSVVKNQTYNAEEKEVLAEVFESILDVRSQVAYVLLDLTGRDLIVALEDSKEYGLTPDMVDHLIEFISFRDKSFRIPAAQVLAYWRVKEAVDPLIQMFRDGDREEREAAREALETIVPKEEELTQDIPDDDLHAFRPGDALLARRVALFFAVASLAVTGMVLFLGDISSWQTKGIGGAIYALAMYLFYSSEFRYAFLHEATVGSLEKYTRDLGKKEVEAIAIASSDGYRHDAFGRLSRRQQDLITLHEAYSHFMGMILILPGAAEFFINVSNKRFLAAKDRALVREKAFSDNFKKINEAVRYNHEAKKHVIENISGMIDTRLLLKIFSEYLKTEPEVALAAVRRLENLKDPEMVDVLVSALNAGGLNKNMRDAISNALFRIGEFKLVDKLDDKMQINVLKARTYYFLAMPYEGARTMLSSLIHDDVVKMAPILSEAVQSEDEQIRTNAVKSAAKTDSFFAEEILINALKARPEPGYIALYAEGLGELGSEKAVDLLIGTLARENIAEEDFQAVSKALKDIGTARSTAFYFMAKGNVDSLAELAKIPGLTAVLKEGVFHKNGTVSETALLAVARLGLIKDVLKGREGHAFKPASARSASRTFFVISLAGVLIFSLYAYFGPDNYSISEKIITLTALFLSAYSLIAGKRFQTVYRDTYKAIFDHVFAGEDITDTHLLADGSYLYEAERITKTTIASSDWYRHPAFENLPDNTMKLVLIHESFKDHFSGMLAMLPGAVRILSRERMKSVDREMEPHRFLRSLKEEDNVDIHAFKAKDASSAGVISILWAVVCLMVGAANHLILGCDHWAVTAAFESAAVFLLWSSARYFSVASAISSAIKRKMPDESSIDSMEIASSDGYRHEAFKLLSGKHATFITLHEAFESHFLGMIAMMPIVSWAYMKYSNKAVEAFEKMEEFWTLWNKAGLKNPACVISAIRSGNIRVQDRARKNISEMEDVGQLLELLESFNANETGFKLTVIRRLGELKDQRVVDKLVAQLNDEIIESSVYHEIILTLGKIDDIKAQIFWGLATGQEACGPLSKAQVLIHENEEGIVRPILEEALGHNREAIFESAVSVITQMPLSYGEEILMNALKARPDEHRIGKLSRALGKLKSERAVEPLIGLLTGNYERSENYWAIVEALEEIGTLKSKVYAYLLRGNPDHDEKIIALSATGDITPVIVEILGRDNASFNQAKIFNQVQIRAALVMSKLPKNDESVKALIGLFGRIREHNLFKAICETFGRLKAEEAARVLFYDLTDYDLTVKLTFGENSAREEAIMKALRAIWSLESKVYLSLAEDNRDGLKMLIEGGDDILPILEDIRDKHQSNVLRTKALAVIDMVRVSRIKKEREAAAAFKQYDDAISDTASLAGVDAIFSDLDGVDKDHSEEYVPDETISAKRDLSDMGVRNITVSGAPYDRFIAKMNGSERIAGMVGEMPYYAMVAGGNEGYVFNKDGGDSSIPGFNNGILGTDQEITLLQNIARDVLSRVAEEAGGKEAFERIRIKITRTSIIIDPSGDEKIKALKPRIADMIRSRVLELQEAGALCNKNIVVEYSAKTVDIMPDSKGASVIQMIKLLGLKKVTIIADSIGTERSPGNDRSMLTLTREKLREAGIDWEVDLLKFYVGREKNAEIPEDVIVAPQGEKETTPALKIYGAINEAKRAAIKTAKENAELTPDGADSDDTVKTFSVEEAKAADTSDGAVVTVTDEPGINAGEGDYARSETGVEIQGAPVAAEKDAVVEQETAAPGAENTFEKLVAAGNLIIEHISKMGKGFDVLFKLSSEQKPSILKRELEDLLESVDDMRRYGFKIDGNVLEAESYIRENINTLVDEKEISKSSEPASSQGGSGEIAGDASKDAAKKTTIGPKEKVQEPIAKKTVKTREKREDKEVTELFEIVEETINNRRAKLVREGNILVDHLNASIMLKSLEEDLPAAEIKDRLSNILESMEEMIDMADRGMAGVSVGEREKEAYSYARENIGAVEADAIVAGIIVLARDAKRDNEKLIIGLETDWIPGYSERSLQHNAIYPLMKEIGSLDKYFKDMGLDNVIIIQGKGDGLANEILTKAKDTSTKLENVIVLASKATVETSTGFAVLKSTPDERRAFIAAIDPSQLELSSKDGMKFPSVKILEMLAIAIDLSAGKERPSASIIYSYDKELRIVVFIPKAEPVDYEALKAGYEADRKALVAA